MRAVSPFALANRTVKRSGRARDPAGSRGSAGPRRARRAETSVHDGRNAHIEAGGSHVPHESLHRAHAAFMPATTRAVDTDEPSSGSRTGAGSTAMMQSARSRGHSEGNYEVTLGTTESSGTSKRSRDSISRQRKHGANGSTAARNVLRCLGSACRDY